jgi:hypothetical protein
MESAYSNRVVGFTKLFSTIIHSTVWRTDMHVKVVWVTLLAMADRNGRVWASVPGLADAARVSLKQCTEALDVLLSPDEWSRTKTDEGRRIKEIDGGWELLNYLKYREMRDEEERRFQTRQAVARHREKKAAVSQGKPRKPMKAQAEAEAEADPKKDSHASALGFEDFWARYPKKRAKDKARQAWNKRKMTPEDVEAILSALDLQVKSIDWLKEGGQFIPYPATYINQGRWTDELVQEDFYRARL